MEDLENKGVKYELGKHEGNSLWLADDTTIIANSADSLRKNIEILRN